MAENRQLAIQGVLFSKQICKLQIFNTQFQNLSHEQTQGPFAGAFARLNQGAEGKLERRDERERILITR